MTTSDWVTSILTGVLVLATIYYAKQTRATVKEMGKTVKEMRLAREAQVTPKLIGAIEKLGYDSMLPRVVNMGVGPAIDVKLTMTLEPDGPSVPYRAPFMSPGRGASLIPKGDTEYLVLINEFEPYETFLIEGECWDALGQKVDVHERFQLRAWIEDFRGGMQHRVSRLDRPDEPPLEQIAEALINIEDLMRREQEAD
jgi:hypothetical protein